MEVSLQPPLWEDQGLKSHKKGVLQTPGMTTDIPGVNAATRSKPPLPQTFIVLRSVCEGVSLGILRNVKNHGALALTPT
jgi:hypothetical protein